MLSDVRSSPKSPKASKRFFVFPLPGTNSANSGEAGASISETDPVPPLPSMPPSALNHAFRRGINRTKKHTHTASSSIASSFSSSSVNARPSSGSINSHGGGNGFSGAIVVRTPQEALEGIKCVTTSLLPVDFDVDAGGDVDGRDREQGDVTPGSAQPEAYRQPFEHSPSQGERHLHTHPHPHGHFHSASLDQGGFTIRPSPDPALAIHRSASAREELRPPPPSIIRRSSPLPTSTIKPIPTTTAPTRMREGVIGIKGVLKSTSGGYLREQAKKDGWEREMLSPSLVSELSLGAPLSSFLHTSSATSVSTPTSKSSSTWSDGQGGENGKLKESEVSTAASGHVRDTAPTVKTQDESLLSPRERKFNRSPIKQSSNLPQHELHPEMQSSSRSQASLSPTLTLPGLPASPKPSPRADNVIHPGSRSPPMEPFSTSSTAATSPSPQGQVKTPSSPGPNFAFPLSFRSAPIPPPPSSALSPLTAQTFPSSTSAPPIVPLATRESSLPSNRHTTKPVSKTRIPIDDTPSSTPPIPSLPPLPASACNLTSKASSPASTSLPATTPNIAAGPTTTKTVSSPRSALKSKSTFAPKPTSTFAPLSLPVPVALPSPVPTPFHATLLGQEMKALPHGEEDITLLRIEFAYQLDQPTSNEILVLPLEVLRKAGKSKLLTWVEGHLSRLDRKLAESATNDGKSHTQSQSQRQTQTQMQIQPELQTPTPSSAVPPLSAKPVSEEEKKASVVVPDMTDGESAEESDLESDNGLTALLNDEYLKSLFIVEPDSPTLGREDHQGLQPTTPSISGAGVPEPLPDLSSITMNDQTKSRFRAKMQEMGLGLGFKRVPSQTRNQYLQLLAKFPIASAAQGNKTMSPSTSSSTSPSKASGPASTGIDVVTISAPTPISMTTPFIGIGGDLNPNPERSRSQHPQPPRLDINRKFPSSALASGSGSASLPSSFEILSPLPEAPESEFQLQELKIFLTREAGVWHRLAHRLISGVWGEMSEELKVRVRDELVWVGMGELVGELGLGQGQAQSQNKAPDAGGLGLGLGLGFGFGSGAPYMSGSGSGLTGGSESGSALGTGSGVMKRGWYGTPPPTASAWSEGPAPSESSAGTSRGSGGVNRIGSESGSGGADAASGVSRSGSGSGSGNGELQSGPRHRDMRKQKSMVLKGGKGYI